MLSKLPLNFIAKSFMGEGKFRRSQQKQIEGFMNNFKIIL
jgi:hypothetical protein